MKDEESTARGENEAARYKLTLPLILLCSAPLAALHTTPPWRQGSLAMVSFGHYLREPRREPRRAPRRAPPRAAEGLVRGEQFPVRRE